MRRTTRNFVRIPYTASKPSFTRRRFNTTSLLKNDNENNISNKNTNSQGLSVPSKEEVESLAEIFEEAAKTDIGDEKTQETIKAMARELNKGIDMDELKEWIKKGKKNNTTPQSDSQSKTTPQSSENINISSDPTTASLHKAKPPTGDGKIRRVYNQVKIYELSDGTFEVGLKDGHQMTTNTGVPLSVPNRTLADLIASEWESHGAYIRQSCTPLTELCMAAIDRLTVNQDIDIILNNVDYDPLFMKAEQPESLRQRQDELWDPLIQWFNTRFGTRFHSTYISDDVMHLADTTQPADSHETLETVLRSMDPAHLVAFKRAYDILQSFVVTFAFLEGRLSVDDAIYTAAVEQEFQAERWGKISGFYDVSRADWRANLAAINVFRRLYPDHSSY